MPSTRGQHSPGGQPVHTKQLRRLAAVLFAFALIASACGGGDSGSDDAGGTTNGDASSGTTADTDAHTDGDGDGAGVDQTADGSDLETGDDEVAQAGGVLRLGLEADPATLNPASAPFSAMANVMGNAVFDTLTVWDENNQWVDNLTESWTPNEDFTAWDMKLRPGITFHDGTPLDADAVLRNFEEQANAALLQLFIGSILGDPPEKVDDLTVRIFPAGPNSLLPAYYVSQIGMMASPAWFDALENDPGLGQMPVGAGPFEMESRVQDSVTRMVRNENWWRDDQEIFVDAVEFYPLQQEVTRTDQFLAGDLDIMHATDSDSILRLREDPDVARFEESEEDFFLIFNAGSPPFDDLRVRQAATHAFPDASYREFITQGVAIPADSLYQEGSPWRVDDIVQNKDQPDLAAPLIDAYCGDFPENCTDGRVDIEYQNNGPSLVLENIQDVIATGWEPYFNITHQVIPQDEHINEVVFGLFDVATWRYHGFLDPELESAFFSCNTIGALSVNFARNCNAERDALIAEQRTTADQATRQAIWADIQRDLNDSRQYLVITHNIWITGARDNVKGLCDATNADGVPLRCSLNGAMILPQVWLSN